jgi:hypothetical protein
VYVRSVGSAPVVANSRLFDVRHSLFAVFIVLDGAAFSDFN